MVPRAAWGRSYPHRPAGHRDAAAARRYVDRQPARAAEILALQDRYARGRLDDAERTQISAEPGGRGAGGRVLEDAAGRERIARVQEVGLLAPDERDRGPVASRHQASEA